MTPKRLLILSVLAGLAAVLMVQFQLSRDKGQAINVFRATAIVAPGETVGVRYEIVALPHNYYPNILKEAPTQEMVEFVTQTPVRLQVNKGEIILFRHLEGSVDPGVRAKIPVDMKAVSIEVDAATSVSFLVQPGDLVDVWTIEEPEQDDLLARAEVRPLLSNVRVLAVGNNYLPSDETTRRGRRPYEAVTLLLTDRQATDLLSVRDLKGQRLTLLLRGLEEEPSSRASGE